MLPASACAFSYGGAQGPEQAAVSRPFNKWEERGCREGMSDRAHSDFLNGWKIHITKSSSAIFSRGNFSVLIILLFLNGFL